MPVKIEGQNAGSIEADRAPDQCPICNTKVRPDPLYIEHGGRVYNATISVVYHCPNFDCNEVFIAYFVREGNPNNPHPGAHICTFKGARPIEPIPADVAETISNISPNFHKIYNEAYKAEQFGLMEICGVGYRKALEFLIKDYLITQRAK